MFLFLFFVVVKKKVFVPSHASPVVQENKPENIPCGSFLKFLLVILKFFVARIDLPASDLICLYRDYQRILWFTICFVLYFDEIVAEIVARFFFCLRK